MFLDRSRQPFERLLQRLVEDRLLEHRIMGDPESLATLLVGDVIALDEDPRDLAVGAHHRLVDEIDEPLLVRSATSGQPYRDRSADIGFTAVANFFEEVDETLVGDFGEGFDDGLPNHIAADEVEIGLVRHLEPKLGTLDERSKTGRHVEHLVKALALAVGMLLGTNLGGGFDNDRDDPDGHSVVVDNPRIIEVHPRRLGASVAVQREHLILERKHLATAIDFLHHIAVPVGRFGPGVEDLEAEDLRMPFARKASIGIVVDHHSIIAPQSDDRNRRLKDESDRRLDDLGPCLNRSERRARPVELRDQASKLARNSEEARANDECCYMFQC